MGGALYTALLPPDPIYPATGTNVTVKVQCSHDGTSVDLVVHRGCRVTSAWTAAHLKEALEAQTSVFRDCQSLMFAGKTMGPDCTIQAITGLAVVPDRIKLYMLVDRDRFPQRLGPYLLAASPLEAADFRMPELTEELKRSGFYWELRTGILESHGLRARHARVTGQTSPAHPLGQGEGDPVHQAAPKNAHEFVFSYPVAGWERVEHDAYAMDDWEKCEGGPAVKSFLSVGGFIYLDIDGAIVGVCTLGRGDGGDAEAFSLLRCGAPQLWARAWSVALAGQGRFQRVTMREVEEVGARMFCWLRPDEVLESTDGEPLTFQPHVPHGGFVYLFHEDVLDPEDSLLALDRYFPVVPDYFLRENSMLSDGGLFRPVSLVDEDEILSSVASVARPGIGRVATEDFDWREDTDESFSMDTPANTPERHRLSASSASPGRDLYFGASRMNSDAPHYGHSSSMTSLHSVPTRRTCEFSASSARPGRDLHLGASRMNFDAPHYGRSSSMTSLQSVSTRRTCEEYSLPVMDYYASPPPTSRGILEGSTMPRGRTLF